MSALCIVESEIDMVKALEDVKANGCNALCVYLGNFGPEISETLLAKHFDGPKMFVAAAEETQDNLIDGRGDAYCGMLNASYNLKLRNVGAYIPEYPVGDAGECADMIHEFLPIARAIYDYQILRLFHLDQDQIIFVHVMPQLSSYTTLELKLRKIQNLIYSRHTINMKMTKESLKL